MSIAASGLEPGTIYCAAENRGLNSDPKRSKKWEMRRKIRMNDSADSSGGMGAGGCNGARIFRI